MFQELTEINSRIKSLLPTQSDGLYGIDESIIDAAIQAFSLQNTDKVNYVKLIRDVKHFLGEDKINKFQGINVSHQILIRDFSIVVKGLLLEVIQDSNNSLRERIFVCLFFRGFFETISVIYNIEVIEGQQIFLSMLNDEADRMKNLLQEEFDELMAIIDADIPDNNSFNNDTHIIPQIKREAIAKISDYLASKGLIKNSNNFTNYCMGKGGVIYVNEDRLAEFLEVYKRSIYGEKKAVKLSKGKAFLKHLFSHLRDNEKSLKLSHLSQYHNNLKRKIGYNAELVKVAIEFINNIISKG